jgi:hypothetical protein
MPQLSRFHRRQRWQTGREARVGVGGGGGVAVDCGGVASLALSIEFMPA